MRGALDLGGRLFRVHLVNRVQRHRRTLRTAIGVRPYVEISVLAVHVDSCPAAHIYEPGPRDCTCGADAEFQALFTARRRTSHKRRSKG